MKKWILVIAGLLLTIIVVGFCYALRKSPTDNDVRINIPAGATCEAVADTLRSRLGDGFGAAVFRLWRLQGGSPEAAHGSYVVRPGERAVVVGRRISRGRQTPVRVTFNNVRTLEALAERVSARMEFDADDFLAACDSVLPDSGFVRAEQYPAAFLPDTYEFLWTTPARRVVGKMLDVRNSFWSQERRAQASALGLTPVEVATVASIVEEESSKVDEYGKIARLYINRLQRGIKLQADPTVKFGVGDFTLRRIRGEHLSVNSDYNTYRVAGLPPGPIRIPERTTLDAVLTAPQHRYIYMCAKEDFSGYHNFAADYPTHRDNARRYQAELNRRGIN